ncbi:MAG: 3-dehydroquinate synthase [Clostridia bacterium]|nr:3-dehydroquinate synthase [Clostridia bacterium]
MIINMDLGKNSYDIVVEHGCMQNAAQLLNLDRKVLIVTDSGVPAQYSECIAAQCKSAVIERVEQGEGSKSFEVYEKLLRAMLREGFTRSDCVVAVGGGVVGDLAGFVAASFMRGVDFYNIPTTVLSQIDSSIGGKVAINVDGIKNIVGAFYQPKKVLIDPEVLKTLPQRQISNGLAEAIKMSLTSDAELFEIFENGDIEKNMDTIITKSLIIKRDVVQQDEKETGLRKILNFGHTIGHGIESEENLSGLYHGECVALGMLPMCSDAVRSRLAAVLKKVNLPTELNYNADTVCQAMLHDKKWSSGSITVTYVNEPGSFEMKKIDAERLTAIVKGAFGV